MTHRWLKTKPDSWYRFYACNTGSPLLGYPYGSSASLQLVSAGYGVTTWTVDKADTPGTVYIKDYLGQGCLTDNGVGAQVTMANCTPGLQTQLWRIP